jgi:membrane protein implicated in regulation of membrane protease activity
MHLVAIGWMYVVLMMAVAEALSSQGTVLGALFTILLYGVLPLTIVLYILGTPARKRALRRAEQQAAAAARQRTAAAPDVGSAAPDGGGHASGSAVAPERKEA